MLGGRAEGKGGNGIEGRLLGKRALRRRLSGED